MKPFFCIILFMSLVIAAQTSAFALTSDSMRCTEGLVAVGDTASDLVRKCGQPTHTSQHAETTLNKSGFPGQYIITTTVIDEWTFNFGRDRFQYRILLTNDRVWKIESLDYGY
jgi:hypothetical protein